MDKVTVVELDDEETFVDQEDFDAPMRVAFSDQDVSDLANRLGLDYGDALPGEEMEKATVDLATMTPRQIFWFEM